MQQLCYKHIRKFYYFFETVRIAHPAISA